MSNPSPTTPTTHTENTMIGKAHRRGGTRAALAGLAAFALLLTGCSGAAESGPGSTTKANNGTPVSVALGFLKNTEYAGNFVADDSGFYADAGVKPTFIAGGPNAPAPEVALASGQAQIAFENNTSRLFSYLAKSQDIVIIGQVLQRSPNGLLSLKTHPVRTPADLNGSKLIAAASNRSSIDTLIAINQVPKYTFVPGGADVGALQAGQGDALLSFASNQPVTLQQQGLKEGQDYFFTPFDQLNYYLMSDVIIVSKSYLEQHRDLVVGFLSATAKGWDKAMSDPKSAADVTVNKYATDQGLDPAQQESALRAQIPYMTSDLTKKNGLFALDPNDVSTKVYPSLGKGGLTGLPEPAKIIDMTVLKDASPVKK
ncbi:ABC transporter substrate-binding protein [Arthrobacter sp. B2a2-09]|uniref:ABC transporter substrate-binding protein n=1 Tax=Arthrobacter sp. B2a2-09 TaxID=2952822 RepID=UPI0022CD8444|nr:ABC transporter substrate-binding protein [Arthrobacter sp. B2a2-09]MCZ9884925.1 ABC transporter substrate-binding protein [Arthrobacter sp. B2a2-09]